MTQKVHVHLTGGLGNQLFQLAAGLSILRESSGKLILDTRLGKPRSSYGSADLFHLELPQNVVQFQHDTHRFTEKVAGYLLRKGIQPRSVEKIPLVNYVTNGAGRAILSLRFRSIVDLQIAQSVGFQKLDRTTNTLLIGYFQSYRYLFSETVNEIMRNLRPINQSEHLQTLILEAQSQKPIFVHVRLQDYLNESQFGIPSVDYYQAGLHKLRAAERKIWVFSDDIEEAKRRMPPDFHSNYHFVDDRQLSPAQVLHLFRFGSDYLIANSSFSWWGAALAMISDSRVLAPKPWFSGLPEPRDLVPPTWIREKAQF